MSNVKTLPASQAERKIMYQRKAHKAALDIPYAVNRDLAVRTFLRYLRASI